MRDADRENSMSSEPVADDAGGVRNSAQGAEETPLTDQLQVLRAPWPFLYSVVSGRGIVKNLPVGSRLPVADSGGTLRQSLAAKGIRSAAAPRRKADVDEAPVRPAKRRAVAEVALNWTPPRATDGDEDE